MRPSQISIRALADGVGVLGAAACALHCVALPVLLVLGATAPTLFLGDESFHRSMLWLVVPSALLAMGLGCWRHKDRRVLFLGLLGVVGIVLSATLPHELLGEAGEKVGTVVSAALLIAAHVRNFKLCRSDACQHDGA